MYSTESAWSAKLMSMTDAGWPSGAARLMRRPSPRRLILRPSLSEYSSMKLRVVRLEESILSSAGMSISTLKCPEFAMIAPSFITSKCCLVSTLLLPVTVQNTSPIVAASGIDITRKPSITASSALVGSTSVKNHKSLEKTVYRVPEELDKRVAKLKLESMSIKIDKLTPDQEEYLASWSEGT